MTKKISCIYLFSNSSSEPHHWFTVIPSCRSAKYLYYFWGRSCCTLVFVIIYLAFSRQVQVSFSQLRFIVELFTKRNN